MYSMGIRRAPIFFLVQLSTCNGFKLKCMNFYLLKNFRLINRQFPKTFNFVPITLLKLEDLEDISYRLG